MGRERDEVGEGDAQWGGAKFEVWFSSKQDFARIIKLEFFDQNGQKIDSRQTGSGTSGRGPNMTYRRLYGLQQKVDTVTVNVTYYDELESVVIPIAIRTGVGLGQVTAKTEPRVVRAAPRAPMPKVVVGLRARPDLPIVIQGKPEKLGPAEARKEFHRKAARVVGTLGLPSEIIKELILRKEH